MSHDNLYEKLTTAKARKDFGEYWKEIMKDQQMSEGLQSLLSFQYENNPETQEQLVKDSKHKCEEPLATNAQVTTEKKVFTRDLGAKLSNIKKDNFEPRPSATKYDYFEVKLNVIKNDDFEPRPSATNYNN